MSKVTVIWEVVYKTSVNELFQNVNKNIETTTNFTIKCLYKITMNANGTIFTI